MSNDTKSTARVVHTTDEYTIVINRGQNEGVTLGDTYLIYALGPELTDPDTGELLGQLEVVRGRAKVSHVQEKLATFETSDFYEVPGSRKIIKRDGGYGGIFAALGADR
jgi:hypothetical protein